MARQGNNAKKPASKRYLASERWLKNKQRDAEKRFKEFEKRYPGKYKLIGYQVVRADKEYITEKIIKAPYIKIIKWKDKPEKKKPRVTDNDRRYNRYSRRSGRERNKYRRAMGLQKPKPRPLGS